MNLPVKLLEECFDRGALPRKIKSPLLGMGPVSWPFC